MAENTALQKMSAYMHGDIVKQRFQEVVGHGAGAYIASVVTAVANSEDLQKCQPESVYTSALRAATLRLSVDPATGQAYLVPFGGKATLIVGYKGLVDMAVRTGKYRYINVGPIYEGEVVEEDKITGWHSVTSGVINKKKIIGWLGAFEMNPEKGMTRGYAKTYYMTVEEIHEHAKEYSKSYNNPKSGWKTETPKMERKTVLRLLLRRWGYLDPVDVKTLEQIEQEPDAIDSTAYEVPQDFEERANMSDEEIMRQLGMDNSPHSPEPPVNLQKIEWTQEQINALVTSGWAANDFSAKAMLALSNLPAGATPELINEWGKWYRSKRPIGAKTPSATDAANFANNWYTTYKESVK